MLLKKIIFVILIFMLICFCSIISFGAIRVEDCDFGKYSISDSLYQVQLPDYTPTEQTKIYCTNDEINKNEPENNIIIMSVPSKYSTSDSDILKYTYEITTTTMYKYRAFNQEILQENHEVGHTKKGYQLISFSITTEDNIMEKLCYILDDYRFIIVSERCVDISKKQELDNNIQLILDTFELK